ncbi:hypothetical protein AAG570_003541 [Ranatra chinensis]|uniref:Uncharacterized protein n=1 Tax=Ranatra chinensis TaxID=642074 RepID=A0ABD0Y4L9_9HEMI
MGRRRTLGRSGKPSGTALYSKQDIREQYCITDRQLHGLEHNTTGLFGCLSSYHDSSCSSRSPSLLTVCMKGRAPSDENLAELCRRPGPMPRAAWPPPPYPPPPPSAFHFHRAIYPDPYAWLPEEEEPCRMVRL